MQLEAVISLFLASTSHGLHPPLALPRKLLPDLIVAIGLDQLLQLFDSTTQPSAALAVGQAPWAVPRAHDSDAGDDIRAAKDSGFDRFEVVVPGEERPMWFHHERKAMVAIDLGEGAIYRDSLSASFQR